MTHNYKKLKVWELAMEVTAETYQLSLLYPNEEKFGLIAQIKRSAVSIPSNIAEGSGRNTDKDFVRFLSIALGSSFELETQLILTIKLNLLKEEEVNNVLNKNAETQKMIYKLRDKLNN
jgi:four helix bundle protein